MKAEDYVLPLRRKTAKLTEMFRTICAKPLDKLTPKQLREIADEIGEMCTEAQQVRTMINDIADGHIDDYI